MFRRKSFYIAEMSYVDVVKLLKETDVIMVRMRSVEKHGAHFPFYVTVIQLTK